MTLSVYNTLKRSLETFEPVAPGKVGIYCCGVTVYDYCHLGHARSYIVWDTVRRYLMWQGYQVRYVQNFTDIDDKILNRARQEGSSMEEVAERYTQSYFEDMAQLNILAADAYPRATHTIDGIKRLIYELEQKDYAYAAAGDVYYRVRQFPEYGKLSGRKLEDMRSGASGRVEVEDPDSAKKQDAFDFALWKAAKPGEPAWESPWGMGRPGWHIECSAMVRDCLGETIDIHAGGADLVFPHHENEIAQSEAVTGKPLAKYWMHNGFVTVNGEKMSKSLGNFTTIRDLLSSGVEPMALRLFVLQGQYRKPLDFTEEAIAGATNAWQTLKDGLLFGYQYGQQLGWDVEMLSKGAGVQGSKGAGGDASLSPVAKFQEAIDDDFNFPNALVVLFELAKDLRREGNLLVHEGKTDADAQVLWSQWQILMGLSGVLGLQVSPDEAILEETGGLTDGEIEALIAQRTAARKAKDFGESDRIRDELKAQGITLIDAPGGVTRWHRN
ncbi:MAG TPA: cysteine--tRNA ligase [Oscillatoriaceae cyanobacterium M33_DOE_052]|uniref:Cysteine--tRNA ligase n=1 Tax=Planktothricoides sp. SpSt-374 TaxID=2282167 RepID=A0A7C3ZZJ2_9CYAN|nr:cysteine--tRNA ligase [Oscillatoriaceae cyanobacterium M33_DOE_052]